MTLVDAIVSQWRQSGRADMVAALRHNPLLLRKRSLMLNLAIEEYNVNCPSSRDLDLEAYCDRFQEFGRSIQQSIQKQLEVIRFIGLDDLCAPKWPKGGEDLARFHVLEELGVGARARVYLCLEADVGSRPVVVKATPIPSFEASILGRLNHRNIIPIHSTGFVEDCELYYVCMPYCGRSTLSDVVDVAFEAGYPRRDEPIALAADCWTSDDTRLPRGEQRRVFSRLMDGTYVDGVLKLAIQIADALAHAHQQGILHGDLKPSNVLLAPDGRPLLLDFNLSQDYTNMTGMCGGTLPYMPPEHLKRVAGGHLQDNGLPASLSSDIYSYGALLYELLAGVTPVNKQHTAHDSATAANLFLVAMEQGISSIRRLNPLVSRRLETIVLQCLAFEPNERPATMMEVGRLLQAERRSLSSIGRRVRVRPVLFSAAVGVPLAALTGAVGHVAMQPPRYLADFETGSVLIANGEPERAAEHFAAAVRHNPSFAPARFELGRAQLALGELDLALNEFGELARRSDSNAASMAYLAYCYNLKRLHIVAIPWYERAIRSGATSPAVYNNLAASYLRASTRLPLREQLDLAESHLLKALDTANPSPTIQLNIVRHAVAKSQLDSSYDPYLVWRHVKSILASDSNDPFIESQVALWYHAVLTRNGESADPNTGKGASSAEQSARERFQEIYDRIRSSKSSSSAFKLDPGDSSDRVRRYFLEPVPADSPRP